MGVILHHLMHLTFVLGLYGVAQDFLVIEIVVVIVIVMVVSLLIIGIPKGVLLILGDHSQ